jgi:hypothetical protein
MFKTGKAYRHDTSQDLDIFVIKVRYSDKNKAKLLIRWMDKNSGNIRTFPGSRPDGADNIEIQAKDFQYWKEI